MTSGARNLEILFSSRSITRTRRSSRSSNKSGGSFIRIAKSNSAGDVMTPTTRGRRRRCVPESEVVKEGSSTNRHELTCDSLDFYGGFTIRQLNVLTISRREASIFQRTWREYRTRDSSDRPPAPG